MWIRNFIFLSIVLLPLMHGTAFGTADGDECDKKCEELVTIHKNMANMGWRSSFDGTDTRKIYDRIEGLLSALNENTTELQDNAQAMRDKEQSTANKLLGAASMAATGIGGMELASALAEKKADEAAERDMTAYLATFKCDYGNGQSFRGGETQIPLPGGNALLPLYQEYVALANDLKVRKESLGLQPGIESELILDTSQSGLYDDISTGKQNGAFTSVADAISNPDGTDSEKWSEQKSDTKKKLTVGAVAAGLGVVGGVVGDAIINKNSAKEQSAEILAQRDEIVSEMRQIIKNEIQKCNDLISEYQEYIRNENPTPANDEDQQFIEKIKNIATLDVNGELSQLEKVELCHQ